MKQAAADALNEAAQTLTKDVRANMEKQGIEERTGQLVGSVEATKATPKKLTVVVKSEVFAKNKDGGLRIPKEPGKYNPAMAGRYKHGVPYGRILEFRPKNPKPFFYTAWYENRKEIREKVIEKIGEAWSKEK